MAQNQTLPLGSGLGAIRAPSLQGDANEAAFRRDASSGGILGQLLSKYPTQQQAIDARKSAQSRISDILGGLMGAGGTSMSMPDESVDRTMPTPTYGKTIGSVLNQALGPSIVDEKLSQVSQAIFGSGPNAKPLGADLRSEMISGDIFDVTGGGLRGTRMPLTGLSDQPGDETFGGTIPRATEDIIDFDVPAADFEGEMGEDLIVGGGGETVSTKKKPNESDAEFNARIEREERGDFGDSSVAGGAGDTSGAKESTGSGSIDLMKSALDSYNSAMGRAPSGAKSMAEYKKEFSEATGIDISGDPDNKAALLAFGLALMQNKAGKGFDVGKMLSSVGEAGEKALPLMEKARQEARAGQLAAGQYALGEAKAADAARQKFLVDQSDYLRNRQDKVLDYMQARRDTLVDDAEKRKHDIQLEAVKHGFKIRQQEIKSQLDAAKDDKYDKIETYQLLPNITALKVQRGFDGKKPVYADPGTTGMQVAETYKDVQVKLAMVDDLEDILTTLANEGDKAFGGQVGKIIFDRVNKYSKLVGGPYADVFNKRGITAESEAQVLIDAFVQANKRFISQETGNGVSDGDKKDIRTVAGEVSLTDSLDKNLARLDQVRSLFSKNVGLLENEIVRLGDRTEFSDDSSYEKTQKIVADILTPVNILGTTSFDVRS